MNNFLWEN